MALTRLQAEGKVRTRTRHVGDTTRLTQAALLEYLHDSYVAIRQWLQDVAPELYIINSGDLTVPQDTWIDMSSFEHEFDRVYKIQHLPAGSEHWRPVEAADPLDYNSHQGGTFTWRREANLVYIGPDVRDTATVQVLYYEVPAELDSDNDLFEVPGCLEMPLILGACATTAAADTDDPSGWEKMREAALNEARRALKNRFGLHPQRAGLRSVVGY